MASRRASAPLGLSVAAAMLAGACLAQGLSRLPATWLAVLLGGVGAACWLGSERWRLVGALAVGFAWAVAAAVGQLAVTASLAPSATATVYGRVVDLPQITGNSTRFDLAVDSSSLPKLAGHRLRLAWYGRAPTLDPGSRWRLEVGLRPPASARNPGGFDSARSALAQGRVAEGYVRAASARRPLEAGQGIDAWRDRVSRQMAVALPDGRARFVRALAVGDTRGLDAQDWFVLRATGLTHQIAISGFHVGMVAGLGALLVRALYWVLPWLARRWPRHMAAALCALLVASVYAAVAGLSLPTVRTVLMIAVALGARLWRRQLGVADALALALIAVLLASPLSVLAPGFWLSFLGVAWLLWCMPPEPHQGIVRPFLIAQGVAMVGLLPVTAWFFGQASLLGPIANLVGIPVISLGVVPASLLGLGAQTVWPDGAAACWRLSATLMDWLWRVLDPAGQSAWSLWWMPEPDVISLALALAGAFWLLMPRGTPGKWLAPWLLLSLLWPRQVIPSVGTFDLVVFDVGRGSALLVRTAGHVLLVDAGPAEGPSGTSMVAAALQALGIARADAVLISHGDTRRIGGLPVLRRQYPGMQVVAPMGATTPGDTQCRAGGRWRWDGVDFELLHPPTGFPPLPGENSCVLRVAVPGHAILLPGDIGPVVQRRLVRIAPDRLRADWLLAPRHALKGSVDPSFLDAVAPDWTVVSTDATGRRGAADAGVLAAYRRGGTQVLTTADHGWMRFRIDHAGVHRDPTPAASAGYWRNAP